MLIGNLGRDPEERTTSNGTTVFTMSMAVKAGKDATQWYKVLIWQDKIELFKGLLPYLKKGSRILVMGDLMLPGTYVNKSGDTVVDLTVTPSSINFVGTPQEKEKDKDPSVFQGVEQGSQSVFAPEQDELPF